MKTTIVEILHRPRRAWFVCAALCFVLGATLPASAQWTLDNTYYAMTNFNKAFFYTNTADNPDTMGYRVKQGDGQTVNGFWESAELIEVAVDAYYWSVNNYPNNDHSAYTNKIEGLCNGFVQHVAYGGDDWSANAFNDDLCWACIAFTRAYQVTHNSRWRDDATNNLNLVWNRGRMRDNQGNRDALHYGIGQKQVDPATGDVDDKSLYATNADAPVNFGFVVASYLAYNNTGDVSLTNHADSVYKWAMRSNDDGTFPNLYYGYSGKIRDALPPNTYDYSYNYGIALQAAARRGDRTACTNIANYLMYNFGCVTFPYNTPPYTYKGTSYNLLPNYGHGGGNNLGYNGICLRGVAYADSRGYLTAQQRLWAQANVTAAWNMRNSGNGLIWDDWNNTTAGTQYSWNCSSALVGMLTVVTNAP